jgi:hypothetical protein
MKPEVFNMITWDRLYNAYSSSNIGLIKSRRMDGLCSTHKEDEKYTEMIESTTDKFNPS